MDLDTAGKWFGRLNQENGKTIISEDIFSDIFSQLFGELGEDTIKEAIAKGAASSGFKGTLSAGISGLAGGLSGFATKIGTVGTGLVSFLGSIWPLLAVGGGIFAGVKGYQALNDKFTLTKGMADKHYSQSTQEYANNQSELESLQSQKDSNQERIYELRAKENKSTDEKAELSQLQEENNLLDSQVAIKEKSVDVSKLKAANDAKTKLEKKGYQKNYKKEAYDNQDKTSINDLDEASEMIDYLNQLKSEYKDRVQKIADEGREPSWIEQKGLDSTKKKIDSLESDVADKVTEISDTAKSMKNDDGSLIDEKFKDTVASADAVVQKYLNSTDSTTATSDKMNNIFALSQFSDLKDKLIAAGKSGGTDTVLDIQYVDKGSDGEDPITRSVNPIPIPTIPSTIENDFIYKRWDSEFTKVFADRTITAVYEPSVRNYNVEYILKPTPNAAETVLQSSVGPYGSTIEYTGDLPKYTAEEAAYKYYLFKEWDKSGLVTGNKKIYTVFDSCEYSTGYFDGKDLENLSEVELYTLMKMNLERDKTEAGDTINFKLGIDYDYNDVESKEFISETTEFDGTNYIDTKVSIMDKDRDFTFAIDFEFGSENISGATLAQCFQSNGSNGFRLWYSRRTGR